MYLVNTLHSTKTKLSPEWIWVCEFGPLFLFFIKINCSRSNPNFIKHFSLYEKVLFSLTCSVLFFFILFFGTLYWSLIVTFSFYGSVSSLDIERLFSDQYSEIVSLLKPMNCIPLPSADYWEKCMIVEKQTVPRGQLFKSNLIGFRIGSKPKYLDYSEQKGGF